VGGSFLRLGDVQNLNVALDLHVDMDLRAAARRADELGVAVDAAGAWLPGGSFWLILERGFRGLGGGGHALGQVVAGAEGVVEVPAGLLGRGIPLPMLSLGDDAGGDELLTGGVDGAAGCAAARLGGRAEDDEMVGEVGVRQLPIASARDLVQ